ncbi:MAG: ATP-dependent zinc protease [Bacteroidota bacterium]|jgi:hypothetical protein
MAQKIRPKIGWKEKVDFVDFGLEDVDAKIDTGASTSVLHCSSIALVKRYRKQYVKFIPLDASMPAFNGKEFILPFHKEKRIKNSFGHGENRYIVLTTVRMFGKLYDMEISLRDRSNLEYPVLLGRRFLRGKFVVDVAKANLSYKKKIKKQKNALHTEKRAQ